MSAPDPSAENQTLSPEAQAIIARAKRSFMFSIGLLLVGFIAIAIALVYRSSQTAPASATAPAGAYAAQALRLPQGAEVVSAVATGGTVSVTYKIGPATQVRIFDGATGEMQQQLDIVVE
ncbi:DUF6476 family protein [Paradevosia shaoguanensis]|jgi:hypothetical protein|uniref:DUF6476 family protein n=1 Tax=Paradevosia shaoguanensis TaxID=1335043 RepID=A0AA41QPZ7_9HYPH|nr:DUF6476 family protein [Paradevosia shaoguanensis]KFL28907.1 hypothetical protein JP74_00675 [Devosia sp. 17-2-E-8]QMV00818.1 hypothetical protein GHV40_04635 [Devosia sp. D6-9]CDP53061.1 hypothetical protein [Devosia sp. DBB001]MCF1744398.1 DUF6476 family protein [Paradevosia shaoguanensis]MCI0128881.1 DUF6476 family protein [Paradevosia shaoguanensis]